MLHDAAGCLGMTTESYLSNFFMQRPHLKLFGISLSAENIYLSFTEANLPM